MMDTEYSIVSSLDSRSLESDRGSKYAKARIGPSSSPESKLQPKQKQKLTTKLRNEIKELKDQLIRDQNDMDSLRYKVIISLFLTIPP